jgi:hypothetical protein
MLTHLQNIIDGIERRKNDFEESKEHRLAGMVYACPVEGERYYLQVLLNHVRGATYFDNLKTIGTALTSFHDFFQPIYLHVCGGTSQKLYGLCLIVSFYYHIFLDSF